MSQQDVINLSKAGVSDSLIMNMMDATDTWFQLKPQEVIDLRNAAVGSNSKSKYYSIYPNSLAIVAKHERVNGPVPVQEKKFVFFYSPIWIEKDCVRFIINYPASKRINPIFILSGDSRLYKSWVFFSRVTEKRENYFVLEGGWNIRTHVWKLNCLEFKENTLWTGIVLKDNGSSKGGRQNIIGEN